MLKTCRNFCCVSFVAFLCSTFAFQAYAGAFVHLFEWQWADIASECENHLGPKGYTAVQVSPPQKSVAGSQWWTRYQPISYAIEGRSGSRAEFTNMVSRCNAVGVAIYVDAVINHMAALDRNFPEVPYGPNDFHNCTNDINYGDRWSIQNCDLVGLNDLATDTEYVRATIANYLNDLVSLGVAGFRIDGAKHMAAANIANIVSRLNGNPYIYQEVIGAGGEPVQPGEYTYIGDVTEFNFTNTIGHYFKGRGPLAELSGIGSWSGWLAGSDAVTFVANHDNQRQNTDNTITHKDGSDTNNLAHVFSLAWPYGYLKVMSSYDWSDHDQGPPSNGASSCSGGWLCEHRNRPIANMVGFNNATQDAFYVSNWWDNGSNQIAFGRGNLGFVVINGENGGTLTTVLQTGMAGGTYCDIVNGDFNNGSCTGNTIAVASNGEATFSVPAKQSSAIHVNALVSGNSSSGGNGTGGNTTSCAHNAMYLRGTFNNWDADAMTCNNGVWTGTASFSGSSEDRFKFDAAADWNTNWGDSNSDGIAELYGSDIYVGNAGTYAVTFNDTSLAYNITSSSDNTGGGSDVGTDNVNVNFNCSNGTTYSGQRVYIAGNLNELGNWDPARAISLSLSSYPTWTGTVSLPANTAIEWKCLKREENNPAAGVEWQSGTNNSVNTADTAAVAASF